VPSPPRDSVELQERKDNPKAYRFDFMSIENKNGIVRTECPIDTATNATKKKNPSSGEEIYNSAGSGI
jgi:hypothetical protein